MFWSALAQLVAVLLDVLMARRRPEGAKDLEIAVLRHQLRMLERRQPRPRLARWERLTLALLATKLRHLTSDARQCLTRCLVLVEPAATESVQNGEIVAARLGGEATVKRYFKRDTDVVLEPANTDYAPILVKEFEDFAVLGRVVGLFRRFTTQHTQTIGA